MTSLLRRKRLTTAQGPSTPVRRAASLAVLGVLLCGGFASAQTMGPPVPQSGGVLPAIHPGAPGKPRPLQPLGVTKADAGSVQRAAFQPRPGPATPNADDQG